MCRRNIPPSAPPTSRRARRRRWWRTARGRPGVHRNPDRGQRGQRGRLHLVSADRRIRLDHRRAVLCRAATHLGGAVMQYIGTGRLSTHQSVAYTGTAGTIANVIGSQTYKVRVVVTTAAYVRIDNSPTA